MNGRGTLFLLFLHLAIYGQSGIASLPDTLDAQSHVVYEQTDVLSLNLYSLDSAAILLADSLYQLSEVVITANRQANVAVMRNDGTVTLSKASIEAIPAFLGEHDVVKALQLQPGVLCGGDATRGLQVRGGSTDQNLILLDGAIVYNPVHLYGIFSVFNSDVIESVQLNKGGGSARYGGRLGSVTDIETATGDADSSKGAVSIGVITSKLFWEGPLSTRRESSFSVGIRGCYAGLFSRPITGMQYKNLGYGSEGGMAYYFADINLKFSTRLSEKTLLDVSLFANSDYYLFFRDEPQETKYFTQQYQYEQKLQWGNQVASLRLKHRFSNRWLMISHLAFSRYYLTDKQRESESIDWFDYPENNRLDSLSFTSKSSISDLQTGVTFKRFSKLSTLEVGTGGSYRNILSGRGLLFFQNERREESDQPSGSNDRSGEYHAFIREQRKVGEYVEIDYGLHGRLYHTPGYVTASLLPRFSFLIYPSKHLLLRGSAAGHTQNLHLLVAPTALILNDFWVAASDRLPAARSWNFSGGVASRHLRGGWALSTDVFFQRQSGIIEYDEETDIDPFVPFADQATGKGLGRAYGGEFYVAKTIGKITGSAAYTLSWSERKFDNLNGGMFFPFKYDRRHNLALQLSWKLSNKVELGLAYAYGTGFRITLPDQFYVSWQTAAYYDFVLQQGGNIDDISKIGLGNEKNNYVLPSYQHLDLSFTYTKRKPKVDHIFNVSVYNVYNHYNVFAVFSKTNYKDNGIPYEKYYMLNLIPILPSFIYTIRIHK